MEDRFNTIAGWVLFAGIIALGTSIVAGEAMRSERPEKMGYPIEGVEEAGPGGGAAEKPIESYLATADATKGGDVFKKCAACHNADKGGPNMTGPNLWGVLGEPIGQGKGGFAFSDALAKKGGNWDWHSLSDWLTSPKAFAPGTKMTFA
ncbi:c-type cytochrome, partial [Sphingomonas sp.]|uniref:c-type cytochrome n=1 Tax=Sphingomonas sp. TaxID=28214 RepID=UPI0025CFA3F0